MLKKRAHPPLLVEVRRIWDHADHNAFTDLALYKGKFYCTFRESNEHEKGKNGVIRTLKSDEGRVWESLALIEEEGVDLRDPKLSTTPDGKLHLLMGGSIYDAQGKFVSRWTRATVSVDGTHFAPLKKVLDLNSWLWRLTWHQGVGYGVSYYCRENRWDVVLYKTVDGENFEKVADLNLDHFPSEATVRFRTNEEMLILMRRSEEWHTHALFGRAYPPYTSWEWVDIGYSLGGPNFVISREGKLWICGRLLYGGPWGLFARTALLTEDAHGFRRELILPSFGDTSYPGLVWEAGFLWISYYSSHEGKAAIYLAKILM